MRPLLKSTIHWGTGLLYSTIIIWLVANVFSDSLSPLVFDKALNDYIHAPGTKTKWRSEGWADSYYGQHGFTVGEDSIALSNLPKFILWGDSHVEAFVVPDDKKISSFFNAISKGDPYYCISHGRSGQSVPDYYFAMPNYSKILPNIKGHVILISGMLDVMASKRGLHAKLRPNPWRLEKGTFKLSRKGIALGTIIHDLGLGPFYTLWDKAKSYKFKLTKDTAPTPISSQKPSVQANPDEGWRFLLRSLKQQGDVFVFIYCPNIPSLEKGTIRLEEQEADLVNRFHEICKESGIGFIDMTESFKKLYFDHNKLPNGFFNTPPGKGHLNEYGQKIIAESLHKYFSRADK